MTVFGVCASALGPLPRDGFSLIRQMGITHIRYDVQLAALRKENKDIMVGPGRFDWDRTRTDLEMLKGLGFKVLAGMMWAPRWVTGGYPINEPYDSVNWRDGSWREYTAAEKPYLHELNRPPVNSEAFFDLGVATAEELRHLIDYIAFWNEWDISIFYPQKESVRGYSEALRRPLYQDMWIPFMRGFRYGGGGAQIVGPDCAYPNSLKISLDLERDHLRFDSSTPRLDIIGVHAYGAEKPSTIAGSLLHVDQYLAIEDPRQRWITEYADSGIAGSPSVVDWTRALIDRGVDGVFPFQPAQFVEGGQLAWDVGQFRPNATWREMKALIEDDLPPRRRAVR